MRHGQGAVHADIVAGMIAPTRIFIHYLTQLRALLDQVARADGDVARARLHPDMFPLLQQAKTAIGFTLRCSCPLAGRDIVSFGDDDDSLASVFAQLAATLAYLSAIPDADFSRIDALTVDTAAGCAHLRLSGWDYFLMYSLPNFFFHYTMVYAIARQAGVAIGKPDFDGYHSYPPGFSFAAARAPADAPFAGAGALEPDGRRR